MTEAHDSHERATTSARWRVAAVVAAIATAYSVVRYIHDSSFPSDLDHLWYAARALLQGRNPYEAVGPGREFAWAWPVFYPLPAILAVVPLTWLPIAAARIVFTALSAGVLGYTVGPRWRVLWPIFLSESFYLAISRNQWSPLLLAAVWFPLLGAFVAVKPNIGLVTVAAQNRRSLVTVAVSALALVVASFIVRPGWLAEWIPLARTAPDKAVMLLQPGGFLLLGVLPLWRTADARLLLAAALVPQTPSLYDLLLLFALCTTLRQALVLSALTHALQWTVIAFGPYASFDGYYASLARLTVFIVAIPVMSFVWLNHWRGTPASTRPPSMRRRADQVLAFGAGFLLCLQLWILFS